MLSGHLRARQLENGRWMVSNESVDQYERELRAAHRQSPAPAHIARKDLESA